MSNVGRAATPSSSSSTCSTERIPIVARDLLDVCPRKIYFFPRSGKVLVKRLRKVNNDTIV